MLFLSTPGMSTDFTPDNLITKCRTSLFLHSPPLTVPRPATCGDLRRCVAEAVSRYTQRMPKASCCRRPQAPFHAFPISSLVVLFLLTSQSNACLAMAVCHSELLRNRVWRAGGGCGVTVSALLGCSAMVAHTERTRTRFAALGSLCKLADLCSLRARWRHWHFGRRAAGCCRREHTHYSYLHDANPNPVQLE
jgi:hypothetical protein